MAREHREGLWGVLGDIWGDLLVYGGFFGCSTFRPFISVARLHRLAVTTTSVCCSHHWPMLWAVGAGCQIVAMLVTFLLSPAQGWVVEKR